MKFASIKRSRLLKIELTIERFTRAKGRVTKILNFSDTGVKNVARTSQITETSFPVTLILKRK